MPLPGKSKKNRDNFPVNYTGLLLLYGWPSSPGRTTELLCSNSKNEEMMKIGFIGLGIMGSRMAANLAKAGYDIVLYNRTPEKAEAVVQYDRAQWRDTPIEVAKESDILITMLASPEAVREMALGENGFLDYMRPATIWVDSSTVNPSFTVEMAAESNRRKVEFVDAPVAGSLVPAEKGELIFLVGGKDAMVEKCVPLFEAMGKKYVHVGENGKGTSLKMVFNLLLGQAMYAFSEGMSLGQSLGISQETLLEVLMGSPVVAPFISGKRDKLESGNYEAEFPLRWMQKDLQLASRTAYEEGVPLPAVNVIKEIYQMARKQGYGEKDFSAIYEFLK